MLVNYYSFLFAVGAFAAALLYGFVQRELYLHEKALRRRLENDWGGSKGPRHRNWFAEIEHRSKN